MKRENYTLQFTVMKRENYTLQFTAEEIQVLFGLIEEKIPKKATRNDSRFMKFKFDLLEQIRRQEI